ncbi:adenylate kinase [Alicyclobacillus cellulosilyticus]|uniref:Adenylate kinase n=1 Tax=Alicyclobacillus cellulosilyticus TaxID=1003997 RepID=A0A917K7F8_9BACL|nr:adenylate kinase [Alicyclobacillus cellulosilyticus]GGJ00923.1 adenylate kinase [Alicyclobacillus cellulosilyticus]
MQVMLLGLPGAGKGTQAQRIAAEFAVPHISTGDMFRAAIAADTPLGREVKPYLDSGRLVPDELTIRVIRERLQQPDTRAGFLLDGFPRTLPQAEALDAMLAEIGRPLNCVLYIRVPREVLLARLTGRRICRQCGAVYHMVFQPPVTPGRCDRCGGELYQRSDDTEEAVATRLAQYAATEPLVEHYSRQGVLYTIDGNRTVDEVWHDIRNILHDVRGQG